MVVVRKNRKSISIEMPAPMVTMTTPTEILIRDEPTSIPSKTEAVTIKPEAVTPNAEELNTQSMINNLIVFQQQAEDDNKNLEKSIIQNVALKESLEWENQEIISRNEELKVKRKYPKIPDIEQNYFKIF